QAAMVYVQKHGTIEVAARAADAQRPLSPQELAERIVGIGAAWRSPTVLEIKLNILKPFHINSTTPPSRMIPTEFRVEGNEVEGIEYAPGEERRFAFAHASIRIYDNETSILVRFKNPPKADVRMSIRYQACDDSACLPPVTKHFEIAEFN